MKRFFRAGALALASLCLGAFGHFTREGVPVELIPRAVAQTWSCSTIGSDAAIVYRDYNTSGVSTSGIYNPKKSDVRTLFSTINTCLFSAVASVAYVSTASYGAVCDGAHAAADTAAFQSAVATGKTVYAPRLGGNCQINAPVVFTTKGQHLFGDGATRTWITSPSPVTGNGVFDFQTSEPGPWIEHVGFDNPNQPDTAVQSDKFTYPPTIYARSTPRFRVNHVRFARASIAIDLAGNSGGAEMDDHETSCFGSCYTIDGSLDTIRANNIHVWQFGGISDLTTNQLTAFYTYATGMDVGRADDFKLSNSLFLLRKGIVFRSGTLGGGLSGPPFASMTGVDFDTYQGIDQSAGNVTCSSCVFSLGQIGSISSAGQRSVIVTGGTLSLMAPIYAISVAGTYGSFYVGGSGKLIVQGGAFSSAALDTTTFESGGTGQLTLIGNSFLRAANTNFSSPVILKSASTARITAIGNAITDKGTGGGAWFSIANDGWDRVIGNASTGWSNTFPGSPTTGVYASN